MWPLLVVAQLLGRVKGRQGAARGRMPIPGAGAGMGMGMGVEASSERGADSDIWEEGGSGVGG